MKSNSSSNILFIIVVAQFACTSVWFAGNAVMPDIISQFHFPVAALSHTISAVQFGFIIGTLVFALLTISDRYSPSKVFFFSSIVSAAFNLTILTTVSLPGVIIARLLTGFFLAGIYPVGMKIAADYHDKGLGKALGYLVGALVLGTAFPHLLKAFMHELPWRYIILITSVLSVAGGCCIFMFVPNGPFRTKSTKPDLSSFIKIFRNTNFRSAAFGYFGHMWELYSFWTFVPLLLSTYLVVHPKANFNLPVTAFSIIAVGAVSCVVGGYISVIVGSAKTAFVALIISGVFCLSSPLLFNLPLPLFILCLLIWGMAVVADSPQFSTLIAREASAETKGTALTIVNCIGFSITIISIQLLNLLLPIISPKYLFTLLAIGPVFGLLNMRKVMQVRLQK